ncbi:hypothetical protein U1Q18_031505 [Sarracenia purpurea var. burkii]
MVRHDCSSWSPVLHSVRLLLGRPFHGIRRRRSAQSLTPSICSARLSPLIRLVGHPQSQIPVWKVLTRDVELHTRIPFFSLSPLGGLNDGGRSGLLGRPLLRLDWLPAIMT